MVVHGEGGGIRMALWHTMAIITKRLSRSYSGVYVLWCAFMK